METSQNRYLPVSDDILFHLRIPESFMIFTCRGEDNSDEDKKNSYDNKSIIFSYTTKLFDACTAVKELHLEVKKNQIFTLLGPVRFVLFLLRLLFGHDLT